MYFFSFALLRNYEYMYFLNAGVLLPGGLLKHEGVLWRVSSRNFLIAANETHGVYHEFIIAIFSISLRDITGITALLVLQAKKNVQAGKLHFAFKTYLFCYNQKLLDYRSPTCT